MTTTTRTQHELLDQLVQELGAEHRRDGEYHADCPYCGKPAKRGQTHFSMSTQGFYCFVCDTGGGLSQLAYDLNLPHRPHHTRPTLAPLPEVPPPWRKDPEVLLSRYEHAYDRVQAWGAYKPLSLDSLAQFRLGVGQLPLWDADRQQVRWSRYRRLIVPVFDRTGQCVALHGRQRLRCDHGPKWLCATGSSKKELFIAGPWEPGVMVIIVENYVDAILARQMNPAATYVAIGATQWHDHWTRQIATLCPQHVLVWLDHDLAGNGSAFHRRALLDAWVAEITQRRQDNPHLATRPWPQPPQPIAPQIATQLHYAGVAVDCYQWPEGTPPKADMGWFLTQSQDHKGV